MEDIAVPLLENTRREMKGLGEKGKEEKSIIGLLSASLPFPGTRGSADSLDETTIVKAEDANSSLQMSQEEIMAQVGPIQCGHLGRGAYLGCR